MSSCVAVASAFNGRAVREGWPSVCDASLSFVRPEFRHLLSIWRAAAASGEIPLRRDITHRDLRALLPRIAIYERLGDTRPRYRVRLMGTQFASVMGDLTGRFLDEVVPAAFLSRWVAALDASLDAAAPLRFLTRSDTPGKGYLVAEYFEAPLRSDSGEASMVLAAVHFSADKSWSERLTAEREGACAKAG